MDNKDKVLEKYPKAIAERYTKGKIPGAQTYYFLIWSSRLRNRIRLAEGDTLKEAWENARNNIEKKE